MKINFISNIKNININKVTTNPFVPKMQVLKNDVFEKSKEITSFKGHACPPDDFKIKQLYDIPCPCCGQLMATNMQAERGFVDNVKDKKGEELANVLKRYDKYYRPVEKEVVDEIIRHSFIKPDYNIAELVREISLLHRQKLMNEQMLVIDDLKRMSNLIGKRKREEYEKYLNETQELVQEFDGENIFKRKTFITVVKTICEDAVSEENLKKILDIALKMPNSINSASAFFIKYARRGQVEIAKRLLHPGLATTEHVVPKSRDGQNNTANYVAMCANCNSARSSIPYGEFINIRPDMPQNLQKYMDEVVKRIKMGQAPGYENYPYDIAETIKQESGGKIQLEINEYIPVDEVDEEISKGATKEERVKSMQRKIAKKKDALKELKKKETELEADEEYLNLVLYYKLLEEAENIDRKRQAALKNLSFARQNKASQEQRKKNISDIEQELLDPNLDARKRQKDEEALKKARARIKANEDVDEKLKQAETEVDEISAQYEEKRKEISALRDKMRLPEYYEAQEKKLTERLAEIYSMRIKISSLSVILKEKDVIQKRKTELHTKIKDLQHQLGLNDDAEFFVSQEDMRIIQKYEALIKKKDYLDMLDDNDIKVSKKMPRGMKPDFILKEAKNSVQVQLEELKKEPAIRNKITEDQIAELQEQREECNVRLAEINETEKEIAILTEMLKKSEGEDEEQVLIAKLEEIRKEKKECKERIEVKIGYLNIKKQIRALEESIKANIEEIKKIKDA